MARVTRNIALDEARDLLSRVPRACAGFGRPEGPAAVPVQARVDQGCYVIGFGPSDGPIPDVGQEVVLLIDEGLQFFDLRAVYVRGDLATTETPEDPTGRVWYELRPTRTVAWDYGRMRDEPDDH